jgi:peptidoglycan hydrolase-like protein with peptidoglycan-binding domain
MNVRGRLTGIGAAAAAVATIAAGGMTGTASAAVAKPAAPTVPAMASAAAAASAASYKPPSRTLKEGMSGSDVKALQQRLAALKYYPGSIDGKFGNNTLEAVWAFQEVNRLQVDGIIGPSTKKALVKPRTYHANDPRQAATRVEVNLGMGVLVFYKNHQIALISHISSAGHYWYRCGSGGGSCYAKTPTGKFQALYHVNGWQSGPLGDLYNPTYFNYRGYAIHGDTYVPAKPVSHGCVRMPMDIASWFYKDLTISEKPGKGTQIWIYTQW